MAESAEDRHARWTWIHETAQMTGWNFDALGDRLKSEDPPWDFNLTCARTMARNMPCLDMGTGGGERLTEVIKLVSSVGGFISRRSPVHASEGWRPNVEVAKSALSEWGIKVREYDSESGKPMPWSDDFFGCVMNRHESYDPSELARVIKPEGIFITQQVDGTEAGEFRRWFGSRPQYPENRLEPCMDALEAQGFKITDADEWTGTMEFADVEAVIEYLAYIPWDVPGFTVESNLAALDRLATRTSPIEVTQKRFHIIAER